eukprot:g13824.t1
MLGKPRILCLEVGEHVPKPFAPTLLANLKRHATKGLVMSWSDDWEGIGHVNCLSREDFVAFVQDSTGFRLDATATELVRQACEIDYIARTLAVFRAPDAGPKAKKKSSKAKGEDSPAPKEVKADPDEPILIKKQSLSDVDVADSCAERGRVIIALPMKKAKASSEELEERKAEAARRKEPGSSEIWGPVVGLVYSGKLSELRGVHVGVDAVFWLRSIQALKDPFADALGGIPPGMFGFVDKELDAFKEAGITPLFVFQGVAPGQDMAWNYLAQGEKSAAQKCFAVSTSRINGDFVYFIYHHLRNRGYECLQAPYFAGAQLAHFAEQGVVQTIFGPPGLLLYGVKSVVIHLNFSQQAFDWVALGLVAQHLHRSFHQKKILCKAFWEPSAIRQAFGSDASLPPEARVIQPAIVQGLRWRISGSAVKAEMQRQGVSKVDFSFCLNWHSHEFESDGPLMQGITDQGAPSFDGDLLNTPSVLTEPCLTALELMKFGQLTGDPFEVAESSKPFPQEIKYPSSSTLAASDRDKVCGTLLLCRVMNVMWDSDVDFDLAAFHALVRALKRTLRQLVEGALAHVLLPDG